MIDDDVLIAKIMATTGIDRAGAERAVNDGGRLAANFIERSSELANPADEMHPAKKKRKLSTSPTVRTLAECRKRGWAAGVVEKFVRFPPPGHHVDLFGVIDVVAIVTDNNTAISYVMGGITLYRGVGTIGIQACAGGNGDHARRRAKILAEPRARQWIEAGNRLELWSWSKRGDRGKRKLWTLRVEQFTIDSWSTT